MIPSPELQADRSVRAAAKQRKVKPMTLLRRSVGRPREGTGGESMMMWRVDDDDLCAKVLGGVAWIFYTSLFLLRSLTKSLRTENRF